MERIENVSNPIIGNKYIVACIQTNYYGWSVNNIPGLMPILGPFHHDKELELKEYHYHVDWRFISNNQIKDTKTVDKDGNNIDRGYFTLAICKKDIVPGHEPIDQILEYINDFEKFPQETHDFFNNNYGLSNNYKNVEIVDNICPHKGANLKSCKPRDGILTCPLHGLKWNIKT